MSFMKNYFKQDSSGRSDAFYQKKEINFDNKFFKKFINYAKIKKKNIRICCHQNKKSALHNMINLMFKKNNEQNPHKHLYKDEVYNILYGKLEIQIYAKKKKKIFLNSQNKLVRIPKNTFHLVKSLTNISIFHEIRLGPFKKNDSIYRKN